LVAHHPRLWKCNCPLGAIRPGSPQRGGHASCEQGVWCFAPSHHHTVISSCSCAAIRCV
jgi:hypothetical protein